MMNDACVFYDGDLFLFFLSIAPNICRNMDTHLLSSAGNLFCVRFVLLLLLYFKIGFTGITRFYQNYKTCMKLH